MLALASIAQAGILTVCESIDAHPPSAAAPVQQRFLEADGRQITLRLSDVPLPENARACSATALPIGGADVAWSTLVSRQDALRLKAGIGLQGVVQGQKLEVSDLIAIAAPDSDPTASPETVLAPPRPVWRAFGSEERARVDGELLICAAGLAPAGFVWMPEDGWPGDRPHHLLLQANGHGQVTWAIADAPRQQREAPLVLGTSALGNALRTSSFEVPASSQPWRALSVICPPEGARINIAALALRPTLPQRAGWVWSPAMWSDTPERIWTLQERHRLTTVFITVPTEGAQVRNEPLLRDFLARASERGLRVWTVIGDPADVLPAQQAALVQRLQAYRAYNRDAPPDAALAGVQLDIEPYLLPGYRLDPAAWRDRYLQLAALARQTLGDGWPLDLVVPVWWGSDPHWGPSALDRLAPLGVSLTIMNYRTDLQAVRRGAQPFLAWGARQGRKVTMALEYGPIPDEVRRHYQPSADGGELWLLPVGPHFALVLLNDARAGLPGQSFRFTHQRAFAGDNISFAGRPEALAAAVEALSPDWWPWPSFAGVALHGLDGTPDQ